MFCLLSSEITWATVSQKNFCNILKEAHWSYSESSLLNDKNRELYKVEQLFSDILGRNDEKY